MIENSGTEVKLEHVRWGWFWWFTVLLIAVSFQAGRMANAQDLEKFVISPQKHESLSYAAKNPFGEEKNPVFRKKGEDSELTGVIAAQYILKQNADGTDNNVLVQYTCGLTDEESAEAFKQKISLGGFDMIETEAEKLYVYVGTGAKGSKVSLVFVQNSLSEAQRKTMSNVSQSFCNKGFKAYKQFNVKELQKEKKTSGKSGPYVIIYDKGCGFKKAARRLKELRNARTIVYDLGNDAHYTRMKRELLPKLRRIQPANVAVFISPENLGEKLAYEFWRLAKRMEKNFTEEEDYDTDFSYGFITGVSPQAVEGYVRRVEKFESGQVSPQSSLVMFQTGRRRWEIRVTSMMRRIFKSQGFGVASEHVGRRKNDPKKAKKLLQKAGVVCSTVKEPYDRFAFIESGEMAQMDNPLIVFNAGGTGGAVSSYYTQEWDEANSYEDLREELDPERSMAVNMLQKGALAYVARVNSMGAPTWLEGFADTIARDLGRRKEMNLGDLVRGYYNETEGPKKFSDASIDAANYLEDIDKNRLLNSSLLLFGDPKVSLRDFIAATQK